MGDEIRKQTYRPRGQVRRLLLRAARELFAARGYRGTSTRAIAEQAGVANSLLHRHFSSKAQLFEEAVFEPFASYIEEQLAGWEQRPTLSRTLEEEYRFFVSGLYDLLRENRDLLVALMAGDVYEDDLRAFTGEHPTTPISRLLDRLEEVTERDIQGRGLVPVSDMRAAVRLTFGMVLSAAVFQRWVFPAPNAPSRDRLLDEIVSYMLHGVAAEPGS